MGWKRGLKAALWFLVAVVVGLVVLFIVVANWPIDPAIWWVIGGFIVVAGINIELEKRKELAWTRHYEMTRQLGKIEERLASLEYKADDIRRRIPLEPDEKRESPFFTRRL